MFLLWLQYQTLVIDLAGILITACCKIVLLYIYFLSFGELGERERPSLNPEVNGGTSGKFRFSHFVNSM